MKVRFTASWEAEWKPILGSTTATYVHTRPVLAWPYISNVTLSADQGNDSQLHSHNLRVSLLTVRCVIELF